MRLKKANKARKRLLLIEAKDDAYYRRMMRVLKSKNLTVTVDNVTMFLHHEFVPVETPNATAHG